MSSEERVNNAVDLLSRGIGRLFFGQIFAMVAVIL